MEDFQSAGNSVLRIGTRLSPMAVAQTKLVKERLEVANPGLHVDIVEKEASEILIRLADSVVTGGKVAHLLMTYVLCC